MVVNMVVNYRCKRKMLKEAETKKQYTFLSYFVIGDILIGRGWPPEPFWLRLWGPVPCGKSIPGYCITFIKRLDQGMR